MENTLVSDNIDNQPDLTVQFMRDGTEDNEVMPYLAANDDDEVVAIQKLSHDEAKYLLRLEEDIDEAMAGFNDIGFRLYRIKEQRLYRGTHTTFAAYVKERFGISRVHADRCVNAYKTEEVLKKEPIGSTVIPESESAMRPLNNCSDEEKRKVGKYLQKHGKTDPTAKDVENAIAVVAPAKASKTKTKAAAKPVKTDPNQLELALADIDEAVAKLKDNKPEKEILASLLKAQEHIKAQLNPRKST